ncbi:NAD-dependent epimerase/dehydratase family protein [Patescibacteria group bacterium]
MNVFITGGAGFIGSNSASYYLSKGHNVIIFDNLSRDGAKKNIDWLTKSINKPHIIKGEIKSPSSLNTVKKYLKTSDLVLHLAAQVAVTTSVTDPRDDFEINALGTFNLLEVMRKSGCKAKLIYSSTNKVYGGMKDIKIKKEKTRYLYKNLKYGVNEERCVDFHSPYGCSKGAAGQYVHDYERIYGLDTTILRQSCIYGPRQFGVEDQGWVAWFIIALVMGKNITIYGDGKQVRDLLFIDDLVECYDLVYKNKKKTKGQIYNIGGGIKNTMSVWSEFGPILESLFKKNINPKFVNWRPGDQLVYVSDIRRASRDFGWTPKIDVRTGVKKLFNWVMENRQLFQ